MREEMPMPPAPRTELDLWTTPPEPDDPVDPEYEEWLAAEIEAALEEVAQGKVIPAEEVWRKLGLE